MDPATVHLEPADFRKMDEEDCTDCHRPTRYWLTPHIPLCQECVEKRNVAAEIKHLFHGVWTATVGQPGYDKKKWCRLRELLTQKGIQL